MNDKKYLIDGAPASALDIIKKAEALEADYAESSVKLTSEAAEVLRWHGYTVSDNPSWKK